MAKPARRQRKRLVCSACRRWFRVETRKSVQEVSKQVIPRGMTKLRKSLIFKQAGSRVLLHDFGNPFSTLTQRLNVAAALVRCRRRRPLHGKQLDIATVPLRRTAHALH